MVIMLNFMLCVLDHKRKIQIYFSQFYIVFCFVLLFCVCVCVCIQYIFACLCVSEVICVPWCSGRGQKSTSDTSPQLLPYLRQGLFDVCCCFCHAGSHISFQDSPILLCTFLCPAFTWVQEFELKSQAYMKWIHSSLSTKKKPFTLSLIICMTVCRYVHAGAGAHSGQKETLDCLELESQALWVIRHGCWVLLKSSMCS